MEPEMLKPWIGNEQLMFHQRMMLIQHQQVFQMLMFVSHLEPCLPNNQNATLLLHVMICMLYISYDY